MTDLEFSVVRAEESPGDIEEVKKLLAANRLELDTQIEIFVLCRSQGRLIACAGLDHNVIKGVAVEQDFRGESLSLRLGTEIVRQAAARNLFHLFLYSNPDNEMLFRGWGFYPLVRVPDLVLLMENSPIAIQRYCDTLCAQRQPGQKIGGIVLNANPFTLGHRYLVEQTAAACDWLHVFVVREDASEFSYADRFALVAAGVNDIAKLTLHPGSDYIISRATFPGYFLKEKAAIDWSWAAIDLLLFREYIALALGITHRYVGAEPFDRATNAYNASMKYWLQESVSAAPPIGVVEVPRSCVRGTAISASAVRKLLAAGDFSAIEELVPATTMQFLDMKSPEAKEHSSSGGRRP
jgi:[citrate (pro-3S)-lyase] ligase